MSLCPVSLITTANYFNCCRGLFSFASTTLVLSLYNVHARHITVPNAVVGMALFFGGLAQFLAGMWEFASGNTFGATGESGVVRFHSHSTTSGDGRSGPAY